MASVRGLLNIQSLNELTYEKQQKHGRPRAWGSGGCAGVVLNSKAGRPHLRP
jgi:hypothetical protein